MKKYIIYIIIICFCSCERNPVLHLHDDKHIELDSKHIQINLDVLWNYDMTASWKSEWYYGWDEYDRYIFGDSIGYDMCDRFFIRRYFLGDDIEGKHNSVLKSYVTGNTFVSTYKSGYYDFLIWNDVGGDEQSTIIDESSLDYVTATTNKSINHNNLVTYNQPDVLFSAYRQGVKITNDINDYDYYDYESGIYYKYLDMTLNPVTYIYLIQVIIYNNKNKIANISGEACLTGMSKECNINTGTTSNESVNLHYMCRMKNNISVNGENADIVGGRVTTFGICNLNSENISQPKRHYVVMPFLFNNAMDSTMVFNVTNQVNEKYNGGVITIKMDMDTIQVPTRPGGSGFNAVVSGFEDGGTFEFEM